MQSEDKLLSGSRGEDSSSFALEHSWAQGGETGSVWSNWGNQRDSSSLNALCFIIILYIAQMWSSIM